MGSEPSKRIFNVTAVTPVL